jgi:hypothetical protein
MEERKSEYNIASMQHSLHFLSVIHHPVFTSSPHRNQEGRVGLEGDISKRGSNIPQQGFPHSQTNYHLAHFRLTLHFSISLNVSESILLVVKSYWRATDDAGMHSFSSPK